MSSAMSPVKASSTSSTNIITIFPIKLHRMLTAGDKKGYNDIISWLPGGKSFKVHDKERFAREVMPSCFGQAKYRSFQKNLNMWCFDLVPRGPYRGTYSHPLFRSDSEFLCYRMVRKKSSGVDNRRKTKKGKDMLSTDKNHTASSSATGTSSQESVGPSSSARIGSPVREKGTTISSSSGRGGGGLLDIGGFEEGLRRSPAASSVSNCSLYADHVEGTSLSSSSLNTHCTSSKNVARVGRSLLSTETSLTPAERGPQTNAGIVSSSSLLEDVGLRETHQQRPLQVGGSLSHGISPYDVFPSSATLDAHYIQAIGALAGNRPFSRPWQIGTRGSANNSYSFLPRSPLVEVESYCDGLASRASIGRKKQQMDESCHRLRCYQAIGVVDHGSLSSMDDLVLTSLKKRNQILADRAMSLVAGSPATKRTNGNDSIFALGTNSTLTRHQYEESLHQFIRQEKLQSRVETRMGLHNIATRNTPAQQWWS